MRGALALVIAGLLSASPRGVLAGGGESDEDGSGPLTAGPMSAEAAQAERLYKSERWAEAAVMLDRVTRGPVEGDDGNRQLATYRLAVALYRLRLYHASFNAFGAVAQTRNHLRHREALHWLAELAVVLPDVDDMVDELDTYSLEDVERLPPSSDHRRASTLYYLLGRRAWKRGAYEEAVRLFDRVDGKSDRYLEALIFAGTAYVLLKKSVPAIRHFLRAIEATDQGTAGFLDGAALRELAMISTARVYYTASVSGPGVGVNPRLMRSPIKYWDRIDPASRAYPESLLEQAWAHFMGGDYGRALGNIHTLKSPFFTQNLYPEADVLQAIIAFTTCHYDDTITLVAKMQGTYMPVRRELASALSSLDAAGADMRLWTAMWSARGPQKALFSELRPAVELSLSDRPILRKLTKVRFLDEEAARVRALSASFQRSPLAQDILRAISTAQEIAVLRARERARALCEHRIAEIDKSIDDGRKLVIDVENAWRAKLLEPIYNAQRMAPWVPTADVWKDVEHVVWPFDGEYWRDEIGSYRQLVVSRCDR